MKLEKDGKSDKKKGKVKKLKKKWKKCKNLIETSKHSNNWKLAIHRSKCDFFVNFVQMCHAN